MWAKGRFSHMAEFAAKAKELGFTHIEAGRSVSPPMLAQLLRTNLPISSIHSPCPAVLSSKGIPISSLSLSSLDENERIEAVDFTKQTIDLTARVRAKAVILHMGEVPVDLGLEHRLYELHENGYSKTKEYSEIKEQLVQHRNARVGPYLEAARKSLQELGQESQRKGIMLGIETRFHPHEIPNIDEMAELLDGMPESTVGYWHDVGHAQVQEQLGFGSHEEWLLRFQHRMIGIHLHDVLRISDHYAPGTKDMNWEMVAKYLPKGIIKVCEIGEWNDEEQLRGVIDFLQKAGITSEPGERNEPK